MIGYRGGERVLLEAGAPIPATLPVGPALDDAPPPEAGPERLPLDPGMRWLVDFAEAERVGMGIRIALPPELATGTLDTLLVLRRERGADARGGQRARSRRCSTRTTTRAGSRFVAPGTPTNNTAEGASGFTRRDPSAAASFEVRPAAADERARTARSPRACSASGARCSPASRARRGRRTSTRAACRRRSGR